MPNFDLGGNKAFYSLDSDFIQMPFRQQFDSVEAYYETAFHELVHWSEKRVGFDRTQPENSYALGELIAEIGACFLMGELGLPTTDNLENHAAYVKHWLKGMSGDPRFIFRGVCSGHQSRRILAELQSHFRTDRKAGSRRIAVLTESGAGHRPVSFQDT